MLKEFSVLFIVMMAMLLNFEKYVLLEAKSKSVDVRNEVPFLVLVSMKPVKGIHINTEPPISVTALDRKVTAHVKAVHKSRGYLDSSKPIEVECKPIGVEPGLHKFSYSVNYAYCSEKDGWCRMGRDTVSVTVRVKE
jgi:hypothetical protein